MGHLRFLLVIASVSLAGTACSGSSLVDIDAPGTMGSSSGSGTGVGGDAATGSSSEGSAPSTSVPTADASTGDDADNPADAAALDATLDAALDAAIDASPSDGGAAAGDATPPDDGAAAPPPDGGATFACGPALRCDPTSEYCYVAPSSVGPVGPVEDIVFPLDASSRYSCLALPACDASDACVCIQGGGGVLSPASTNIVPIGPTCSCNDSNGDITRTCTSGGVVPL
jgi:hypothetical protein